VISEANTIELLDAGSKQVVAQTTPHAANIETVALNRSKRLLASLDAAGTVCVSDIEGALKVLKCKKGLEHATRLVWIGDDSLIYATRDGRLMVWPINVDTADKVLATGLRVVANIAYDALSDTVIVQSVNKDDGSAETSELRLLGRAKGEVQWRTTASGAPFAHSDGQIAAQRPEGALILIDLILRNEKIPPLQGHGSTVTCMAFDDAGMQLLSSSVSETLCGHWNLGFDATGRKFVMSGWQERYQGAETRVYGAEQDPPLLSVMSLEDASSAGFLDDDETLIYVATDELANEDVKLDVYTVLSLQDAIAAARGRASRCLTGAQRTQYFLPPEPPEWCVRRRLWPFYDEEWQVWLAKHRAWVATGRQGEVPSLPKAE
jgi:hypothetical protein